MRVGKIISISVVSLASLIVLAAAYFAFLLFNPFRSGSRQNSPPTDGQQAVSCIGNGSIFSRTDRKSSFLYRKGPISERVVRLTKAAKGIESEAAFSHNGKLVVYSFAVSPESKSEIWIVGADGSNPHAVTGDNEDALHPVFSPDDLKIFYAASGYTGRHSPVVRPARHDWDIYSRSIRSNSDAAMAPTQITHASFYDLTSLDAVADATILGETQLLISTTGYPIGPLLEEFKIGSTVKQKIFQPHVLGEPSSGPAYGEARYVHSGMDILFLAATEKPGSNFDYNIFSMSDVTGSEIKQLTHLTGVTQELKVMTDNSATYVNGGISYVLTLNSTK